MGGAVVRTSVRTTQPNTALATTEIRRATTEIRRATTEIRRARPCEHELRGDDTDATELERSRRGRSGDGTDATELERSMVGLSMRVLREDDAD